MDASLMYQAVATGDVDVISAFSTDGRVLTSAIPNVANLFAMNIAPERPRKPTGSTPGPPP
jgi:hypothetical protein